MQPHKVPKPAKLPRPLEDAQWTLTCLDNLCAQAFLGRVVVSEVRLLTGLPETRFKAALAWLKLERIVDTSKADPEILSRNRYQSYR